MKTKFKIVETAEYCLAVSDEKPTVGNQIIYETDTQSVNTTCSDYTENEFDFVIKAYQPKGNAPELDLPLLPEINVEDDVEKLALNWFAKANKRDIIFDLGWIQIFEAGYKTATKTYSEENLKKSIITGIIKMGLWQENEPNVTPGKIVIKQEEIANEIIQSLKQPKTPKWFVAEISCDYIGCPKLVLNGTNSICCGDKTGLKTTTINGKTYLVGSYLCE